jgi:hypothetical protein
MDSRVDITADRMRVTRAMQSQLARGRKKVQMHIEIARTAMMLTEAINNIGEALAMVVPRNCERLKSQDGKCKTDVFVGFLGLLSLTIGRRIYTHENCKSKAV